MNTITRRMNHIVTSAAHAALLVAILACRADGARDGEREAAEPSANASASIASSAPAASAATGFGASLDVASWNIEWFGDPSNGPANESVQLANATAMLQQVDADVWGIAEVVDDTQWSRLVASMPGYEGMLASARNVEDGRRYYAPREQKLGVLIRRSAFTVQGARVILQQHDTDFAGRPPLEVRLLSRTRGTNESASSKAKGIADERSDLTVIVVHMKARNDASSWERRARAARALKRYLDTEHRDDAVIVVGDWNDGLHRSISAGKPSPYEELARDETRYRFTSASLARRGITSTSYTTLIDHHLVSNELAATEIPNSVEVVRPAGTLRNFRSSTSDHFPVVSHFRSLPR